MARESRQKRYEKRFGRPERLADFIRAGSFAEWPNYPYADGEIAHNEAWRRDINTICSEKLIECSNVAEYAHTLSGKGIYTDVITNAMPPFRRCAVEYRIPEGRSKQVRLAGWAFENWEFKSEEDVPSDVVALFEPGELVAKCRWVLSGALSLGLDCPGDDRIGVLCPVATSVVLLDKDGGCLKTPFMRVHQGWDDMGELDYVKFWGENSLFVCLLAFCFMNCKNVPLGTAAHDVKKNRERVRAGLKPFLSYHTIQIEPMKQVLRTEGGIATNGLKKALHICRGHFATYRDNFMGRKLESPVTMWRPSHVRGSLEQGVVVSDYKIHAPAQGAQA